MNIFKKIGKAVKSVTYDKPKAAVTKTFRRKVITACVAALASILLIYGVELPADIQDSLTTVIEFVITLF